MTQADGPGDDAPRPLLRVVRGDPTAEELAALVVVLAARTGASPAVDDAAAATASGWGDRSAGLTPAVAAGPRAWALSGRTPGVRTRAGW